MSKAEKFIKDYTRFCSNAYWDKNDGDSYFPWLTPDQARRAVEIAREEVIEKACEWLLKNVTYTHPRKGTKECIVNIAKLKDDLRNQ